MPTPTSPFLTCLLTQTPSFQPWTPALDPPHPADSTPNPHPKCTELLKSKIELIDALVNVEIATSISKAKVSQSPLLLICTHGPNSSHMYLTDILLHFLTSKAPVAASAQELHPIDQQYAPP
tara:strand:+ start:179 stop:544 length:366 start_codon:yes stop_codon:yes gene_type:complete